jgi:hypothetical protein
MRVKFLTFKRDENGAENFQIGINAREKLQNSIKIDDIIT